VRWLDDAGTRAYISDVDQVSATFPQRSQAAFEYLCHGPAVDSLHPVHVGGPTYVTFSGEVATGKTLAVRLAREFNGLPGSKTILAPVQMGEGGPADLLTKTWDAVKQKQFKTSMLQLLGGLMRERLTQGRDLPGFPNGALNHISELEEAPVDDPEFHRIMKSIEDSGSPYWMLWTLSVHAYLGCAVIVMTTNARMNSGAPPVNAHNDRALLSRQHEVGHFDSATPETLDSDIDAFHEKGLWLYASPYQVGNTTHPPKLGPDDIEAVRGVFAELQN